MGRYTQRRRASSSPSPGAAAGPVPAAIVSVSAVGMSQYVVTFDGPVDFVTGVNFGLGFTINGQGVTDVPAFQVSPSSTVTVEIAGSAWGVGDPWLLDSQPNWLTTPAAPGAGVLV